MPPDRNLMATAVSFGWSLHTMLLSHFSRVRLCATPQMAAHQAPPSLGFSRQEHWSGLPSPSPMHESEKWKWSHSVSVWLLVTPWIAAYRLLHLWDFPGKSTGVGCHCLLHHIMQYHLYWAQNVMYEWKPWALNYFLTQPTFPSAPAQAPSPPNHFHLIMEHCHTRLTLCLGRSENLASHGWLKMHGNSVAHN